MSRMFKWLGMATLSIGLGSTLIGCVPQEKYNALRLENESLTEQLGTANTDAASAKQEAGAYKSQLASLSDQGTSQGAMNQNLQNQLRDMAAERASLLAKLQDAQSQPPQITQTYVTNGSGGGGAALPEKLNTALQDFANANPGLVEFDSIHGIVKFKSDVTFATGSADLQTEAKSVIDKFATILNSPAAGQYELMVAGHTDNIPVTNPETVRRFGNNITLSAHRAISVYEELATQGINKGRMSVAGYGEQRPVAPNNTASGRKLNRRVEVLILPTVHAGSAITAGATQGPRRPAPAGLNKDSGGAAPAPVAPNILNKG